MTSTFVFRLQSGSSKVMTSCEWQVPAQGGMIGRAPACDWVLEDPDKIVSRQHAKVMPDNMQCVWTDLGTNPSVLNGHPLACGQPVLLKHGDQMKIGDYTLELIEQKSGWPVEDCPPPGALTGLENMDLFGSVGLPATIDELLKTPEQKPSLLSVDFPADYPALLATAISQSRVAHDSPSVDEEDPLRQAQALKQMRELLAVSMQGYMRLLGARRTFRQETASRLTVMSASANNPLKVCSSSDEALQLLLADSSGTYLPARQAIEQACDDVLVHMHGSLAHIQSLIRQIHTLLNPEEIEREAVQASGFALGLSSTRKARMWDLYCLRYALLDKKWS